MELRTHEQITMHLRALRSTLQKRHGWTLDKFETEKRLPMHCLPVPPQFFL